MNILDKSMSSYVLFPKFQNITFKSTLMFMDIIKYLFHFSFLKIVFQLLEW